jgi:3-deoxy-D-manno-octulosonate 8-phosphate phosphatase (KDO 8-P phosphatase)
MKKYDKYIFVTDIDGCLTDGKSTYSKDGKIYKIFGPDDAEGLKLLNKYMDVVFISADHRGFDISKKRVEDMGFELNYVSGNPLERWQWIKNRYPNQNIFFMGDGINDFVCLSSAYYSMTVPDALPHVLSSANWILKHSGANRATAEACLRVLEVLNINWRDQYENK